MRAARLLPSREGRTGLAVAVSLLVLLGISTDRAAAQAAAAAPPGVAPTSVSANLNISPKRITFDRADRSATVYIFNQGNGPGTFDIALVDRVMLPDGEILPLTEAQTKPEAKPSVDSLKSAATMLVVTPRRVSLAPGKGQTIRIRAAAAVGGAAGGPTPGEYRTHLTVATIPPRDAGLTAEQAAAAGTQQLSFQINSVFGLSIPVILRVGAPDVRGAIEGAKITVENVSSDGVAPPRPTSMLRFKLVRQGSNSLFGNIEVRGSKDKANADPLAAVRGLGVYPEIDHRDITMILKRAPLPGEQLEISFKDDDTAPGRLVAKATISTQ
jgi:P pilus assembly chaperone PapD